MHSAMMMAYKIEADFQYTQQTAGIFPKYFADPKQSYSTNTWGHVNKYGDQTGKDNMLLFCLKCSKLQ